MTALAWDQPGERLFEAGVDRGVLYLNDGRAVAWTGLTGVDETTTRDVTSFYLDGVKYLERQIPGDFAATLRALTYPEEFDEVNGIAPIVDGMSFHDQKPQSFSFAYRTRVGNDREGADFGYKIHIFYDVMASPAAASFNSLSDQVALTEFTWGLTSTPPVPTGYRPTTHVSFDSTKTDPERMAALENLLYGTDNYDPRLPAIDELATLFSQYDALIIVDNGDGTWTATDLTDSYITMTDDTTFSIANANTTTIDPNTYTISTTNAP